MQTMGTLIFRQERPADYGVVEALIRDAFWDLYQPGCSEHYIVHCLREAQDHVLDLSCLAEEDGRLVGAIFYTRGEIRGVSGEVWPVLSFGPLAVVPERQRQGIGAALIDYTRTRAAASGASAIVIYGNPAYYGRFGFVAGEVCGITDSTGDFCPALQILWLQQPFSVAGRFCESSVFRVDPDAVAVFDQDFPPREKHIRPGQLFLADGVYPLHADNLTPELFDGFQRTQEVSRCWQRNAGGWVLRAVCPFTEEWHAAEYIKLTGLLKKTVQAGGAVLGYFQGRRLVGFASLEGINLEGCGRCLQMSSLHVSRDCRNRKFGRRLFAAVVAVARARGAEKLYISAHPSAETQRFYRAVGCVDAGEALCRLPLQGAGDCPLEYVLNHAMV